MFQDPKLAELVRIMKGNPLVYQDLLSKGITLDDLFVSGDFSFYNSLTHSTSIPLTAFNVINGTPEKDILIGAGGEDSISGNSGEDTIFGQNGADLVYGNIGADSIEGGDGNDTIFGGQNNQLKDTLGNLIFDSTGLRAIQTGIETINSGNGNDLVYGNFGADYVLAGKGADTVFGGQGNDTVGGGDGNDVLYGNRGNDEIVGGRGSDKIFAGSGDDLIRTGGGGVSFVDTGDGNDTVDADSTVFITGKGNVTIKQISGNQTVVVDVTGFDSITTSYEGDISEVSGVTTFLPTNYLQSISGGVIDVDLVEGNYTTTENNDGGRTIYYSANGGIPQVVEVDIAATVTNVATGGASVVENGNFTREPQESEPVVVNTPTPPTGHGPGGGLGLTSLSSNYQVSSSASVNNNVGNNLNYSLREGIDAGLLRDVFQGKLGAMEQLLQRTGEMGVTAPFQGGYISSDSFDFSSLSQGFSMGDESFAFPTYDTGAHASDVIVGGHGGEEIGLIGVYHPSNPNYQDESN